MKKHEIVPGDIQRILFGNAPPEFLLEVLIRTVIIYLLMLVLVKWLGKRMSAQMTITEMAIIIMLGATIAMPMQMPNIGILQGILVMLCILGLQSGINLWGFYKRGVEEVVQGKMIILVKDGVLQLSEMKKNRISRQQLLAELRKKEIYNLGQVKRVYMEACGLFSIFNSAESQAGLATLPESDPDILQIEEESEEDVCMNCGNIKKGTEEKCGVCGLDKWQKARTSK